MAKNNKEFSVDGLSGCASEHYAIAKSFDREFSRREFKTRYLGKYPSRKPGSILPSDFAWNNNQLAREDFPSFLEKRNRATYQFIGLEEGQKRKRQNPSMHQALFINGVFEDILEKIEKTQKPDEELTCVLQPYSESVIKLLKGNDFSQISSLPFYISTTTDLNHVRYVAEIVGLENKKELVNDPEKLSQLNEQTGKNQPIQNEVYFYFGAKNQKECVNLIRVKNLKKLVIPFLVRNLTKVSDDLPHKPRTQSGGWSLVCKVSSELMGATTSILEETLQNGLDEQVKRSLSDGSEERKKRLKVANKTPEIIQIISKGYRRNPDVIAEVLKRAEGVCEQCKSKAPFIRKKDNSPYLEVHHRRTLAKGGKDTVQNAVALCPNCHRKVHFGKSG